MKVLSLCDGMSCGHIALDMAGIKVDEYFAAEIKEIAIKVTKANYPNTVHIGDVNEVSYKDGVLYTENGSYNVGHIDLVIFGSPCQTFSIAMKVDQRVGLENKQKSGLFFECYRIMKEVNPTYFLMKNVGSMKDEDRDFISEIIGVDPVRINSKLVSPQLRDRLYWTNIPGVTVPKDKGIELQSILTSGFTDRKKARALLVSDSRPLTTKSKMLHRYKSTGFTTLIWEKLGDDDSVRYLNQTELERCQTVPEGYTSCLTRNEAADVLGDGWTIDVITHIFSFIFKAKDEAFTEDPTIKTDASTEDEPTDLSDAPEAIKEEIIKNDEILQEQEREKETTEEETMETKNNKEPATIAENVIAFNAVEQLRRLADERKSLADLRPENKRFSDDVRAIEYAVSVLEAVGL